MGRLEYDDSAFLYFGTGICTSFLLPLSWLYMRALMDDGDSASKLEKARTSIEREKLVILEKDKKDRRATKSMRVRGFLLFIGWVFVAYLYLQSGTGAQIEQWNPFTILGVENDAGNAQVKKAYRKLTLKYHPDRQLNKSPDEVAYAGMMFEKVRKAHEVLTDEDAKRNFDEFGNPDGRQSMEVGIGLPNFLLRKENHNLVLLIYLLILVVVIPGLVVRWYSNSKLYGDKLILNDSYSMFAYIIDKNIELKHVVEVLALAAEFRDLSGDTPLDMACLMSIKERLVSEGKMSGTYMEKIKKNKYFDKWPGCARANILIHSYLNRETDTLTSNLKHDLEIILTKSKYLIAAMLDIAITSRSVPMLETIVKFDQHLSQALWFDDSPLCQLPHFTKALAKFASERGNRTLTVGEYIAEGPLTELGGLRKGFTSLNNAQRQDVEVAMTILPNVKIDVKFGVVANENADGTVDFEEGICEGDICTAVIEITRLNMSKDGHCGPVHAPYMHYNKNDEWQVLFMKHGEAVSFTSVTVKGEGKIIREKIQFPTKNFVEVGTTKFDFITLSTSYVGFDHKETVSLSVKAAGTFKALGVHEEDLALDNEPTLFDEIYGAKVQDSDSDFADSDDEKENPSNNIRLRKKTAQKDSLAVDDDADDKKNN